MASGPRTMALEETAVAALLPLVRARSLECEHLRPGCLSVPSLGLEIVASEPAVDEEGSSLSVVYDARAAGRGEAGVRILAIGFGADPETAAASAAEQWAVGVLPVLQSWVQGGHVCEVERSPMVVGVADSEERFGWSVHLGPVIGRAYGKPGSGDVDLGDLSRAAAFKPVFEVIHSLAAHRSVMWVESFACRNFASGVTDATSRVNNDDFEAGREALRAWAASWPTGGAPLLSKRQFLLFEPTDVNQLPAAADLAASLDRAMAADSRAPWWKRLWSRSH